MFGFVDCNYVAPFKRLFKDKVGSGGEITASPRLRRSGQHDITTVIQALNNMIKFVSTYWIEGQGCSPDKIVFLGPTPPNIAPR
jgi:hypothetical protein